MKLALVSMVLALAVANCAGRSVSGAVDAINWEGQTIIIDGTKYHVADNVQMPNIDVGDDVLATYTTRHGQQVITDIDRSD